jgi:hypothetical protein
MSIAMLGVLIVVFGLGLAIASRRSAWRRKPFTLTPAIVAREALAQLEAQVTLVRRDEA